MPYRFEFNSTNRVAWCYFEGDVSAVELADFYREAQEKADRKADRLDPLAAVLDLSGVTSFEVSFQSVRELAKMRPIMARPERPRVIIAKSPGIFGMARLFESEGLFSRPNLHVVHTVREACAILGVPEPHLASHAKA